MIFKPLSLSIELFLSPQRYFSFEIMSILSSEDLWWRFKYLIYVNEADNIFFLKYFETKDLPENEF